MKKTLEWTGWATLTALALYVGFVSYRYFGMEAGANDTGVMAQLRDRPVWFLMHAGGGATALLLGPWQFLPAIRSHMPLIHRMIGRSYLLAILVGGIGGGYIAVHADSGPIAIAGFSALAILWLTTAARAFQLALQKNFMAHRRWMIRSMALTSAAITLRLYIALGEIFLVPEGIAFENIYIAVSWLAWVPNLIWAEWYVRRNSTPRVSEDAMVAAAD